jgi:hypothetical protein
MPNLKNITELPVAESADGLNLIVNDNGSAKQIPANKVGKVKTVNGVSPDTNGNIQIDTASSWNDLKDKPFYSEMEVVLERQIIEGFAEENDLFMAEYPCELNISLGDKLSVWFDGENYACTTINIPDAPEEILGFGNPAFMGGPESPEPFFIIYVDSEKFMQIGTANPGTSHEIDIYCEIVHKLDAKYLPSGGVGYSESETYAIVENQELYDTGDDYQIQCEHSRGFKVGDTVNVTIVGSDGENVVFTAVAENYDVGGACVEKPEAHGTKLYYYNDRFQLHTHLHGGMATVTVTAETVHKIDPKYLPEVGGSGGWHWFIMDRNRVITASEGIYEALENFLLNGVPVVVTTYRQSDSGYLACPATNIYWGSQEEGNTYIHVDGVDTIGFWVYDDGRFGYYWE